MRTSLSLVALTTLSLLLFSVPETTFAAPLVTAPLVPDDPTLALDVNNVNLELFSTGSFVDNYDENYVSINAKTNSPNGYALYLNMTDSNTCLRHTIYSATACASIPTNSKFTAGNPNSDNATWGYSLDNGTTYYAPLPFGSSTVAAPSGTRIKNTTAATSSSGDNTVVTFGAKASPNLTAGNYTGQMVVTATANKPAAPTITAISPATGNAGDTITITGTNFLTAHRVTVGGTDCTSATIVSDTSITCQVPAGTAGSTVDVIVTTWGGTATKLNAFTYMYIVVNYSGWVKADSSAANTDATTQNYTIDIDTNMLPIIRKDDYDVGTNTKWADDTNRRWANAVTIKPDKLAEYQAAAVGAEIAEDDILATGSTFRAMPMKSNAMPRQTPP